MHTAFAHPTAWPQGQASNRARVLGRSGVRAPVVRRLVLAAFVALYLGLEIASYLPRSATYDEPVHLAAGYAALTGRDYRLDPTHPPLVRMWAALPLLGMERVDSNRHAIDGLQQEQWMRMMNTLAHDFLYVRNDADHLLNWSRFMIVLLGAALGLLLFAWAEQWLGFPAAALTLLFYLLSPNLGAHAAMVTTDAGVTLFYVSTLYFLWRACRSFTPGNAAGFAASCALAVLSKFSALLLAPTIVVLLVLAAGPLRWLTWRQAAGLALLAVAVTWAMIWAAYGFQYEPGGPPGVRLQTAGLAEVTRALPVLAPVLNQVDAWHLLPNAYTQGFLLCFATSEQIPSYLLGEISTAGGWWYYYPVAFLVKTPTALLVLFAGGLVAIARRRARERAEMIAFALLPPAIYLGFAMSTGINIGLRHILPVYPFVLLVAGLAVRDILQAAWPARAKWLVLAGLTGFWVTMFAWRYPHMIGHFNLISGGPEHGLDYLSDSNLDWGQHLKRLKQWSVRQHAGRINLAYFGMADPAYYQLECNLLPGSQDYLNRRISKPELPGYVVLSATVQSGVFLPPEWRLFYSGFEKLDPVAVIGHSVKIYWVDRWPDPVDDEDDDLTDAESLDRQSLLATRLFSLGWYDLAVPHLRRVVEARPDDGAAWEGLGLAQLKLGRNDEALAALRRVTRLKPDSAGARHGLTVLLLEKQDAHGAVEQAEHLVRLLPGNAGALDLFGIALACDGRPGPAQRAFEDALRLAPGDPLITEHLNRVRAGRP